MKLIALVTCLTAFTFVQSESVPSIKTLDFRTWSQLANEADSKLEGHSKMNATLSNKIFADGDPIQGHIVLGEDISEMRVMWVSRGDELQPLVKYGTKSGSLTMNSSGTSTTYTEDEMCGAKDDLDGYIYDVLLTRLAPSTKYYYRFGSEDVDEWSKEYSFITPPSPMSEESNYVKFLAYGDMGYFDSGKRVTEMMIDDEMEDSSFVIHVGDLSYADGEEELWDEYMDQIEKLASHLPYFVNIGNHETENGECGVPYNKRFKMPSNGRLNPDKTRNLWYSFNWGPVHLLQMSTEDDFKVGSEQWNFIVNDLKRVNRTETPWVIFTGHKMMYSVSGGSFGEGLKEELDQVLYENKVDLAFWGHTHKYERSCAVYKDECLSDFDDDDVIVNAKAPVHIVMGMAGRSYDFSIMADPDWNVEVIEKLGYTRLFVDRKTLKLEFIAEKDGDIDDEFTLIKSL